MAVAAGDYHNMAIKALPRAPTPAEEIANNQAAVNTLVGTGQLGSGNGTSLLAKLDAAANALASGNPTAAKHELEALIREVQALIRSGRIPAADGQALIAAAQNAINQL